MISTEVEGAKKSYGVYDSNTATKLFVFGDSYVDTGNFVHSESYKPPNGITFPGKPAGRFCDGRILTDYVASFLKIESPTPYTLRNSSNLQYGINFAYGGTGIFNTSIDGPNMTAQIDSFENLIQQNIYTKHDLESSIALVNAGGNDYTNAVKNGRILDMPAFIESLVKQISVNLNRIHSLGINKVAVGLLQPIGCLPALNVISFRKKCISVLNFVSKDHNIKLLQAIEQLNNQTGKSVFITLDLYSSFFLVIETMQKQHAAKISSMVKQTLSVITLLLLIFFILREVEGAERLDEVKLFVFGDSYVDTGNSVNSASYQPPSGITFPAKPAGRFSDGCVLTDYIASFLKIKSPTPYTFRNSSELQYGMNFAHGGTGIFNTLVEGPNMTVQIDSFEKLIQQKIYTKADLESSIALVNAAGNDYATFLQGKHGSIQDIPVFTASLIQQMSLNLRRIHSLGINKIAVGLLEPIGCMPLLTVASSYDKCLEPFNFVSQNHSQRLLQIVQELNKELGKPVFVTLDLYNSFLSVIATMQKRRSGKFSICFY
ncbi:unnamed protein product [Sphenostylis stenocarpa]|uniref:Uncharacterized protein n=1 Tax=Sphenostylis stenocarpa TaxID=92480 RepID=A0AA87B6X2_9FABA|nr:unnamed protein product [Sphenostylis stenocarpa]